MKKVTGKPNLIKLVNKNAVLDILESSSPISRAQIAKKSHISAPTVSAIVDELLKEGLAREVGEGHSSGGRKPTLVTLDASAYYAVGVELKLGYVTIIASDIRGSILIEERYEWYGDFLPVSDLTDMIASFLKITNDGLSGSLKGIGVSIPGVTDIEKGIAIQSTELGWNHVPLRVGLEQTFDVPILLDNDINMATLGEHWRGAGRNYDDLVLVSVGHGIGGGILLNGELFRGSTFSSAEIGHMIVSPNTLHEIERGYGPLENYFGERAIQKRLISNNDEEIETVLNEAVKHLVYAIVNVICVINPKILLLDLHGVLEERFDSFKTLINKLSPSKVGIERASLRKYASLLGAVYSVIRSERSSVSYRY